MLIIFNYEDWVKGRLRLYMLEISPNVYSFPSGYSSRTKERIVDFLDNNGSASSGFVRVECGSLKNLKSKGNLPRRTFHLLDDIQVTARLKPKKYRE